MKRFALQCMDQRVVVKLDRLWRVLSTVDDTWSAPAATQAAARAASFGSTGKGGELVLHGDNSLVCGLGPQDQPRGTRPRWRLDLPLFEGNPESVEF